MNNTIVTDSTHLCALLNRLKKNKCTLEIKTMSTTGTYSDLGISELLSIDYNNNTLLFDEISENLLTGQEIKIFTKNNGIEIYFQAAVTGFTKTGSSGNFTTSIPTEINHKQRRQQYRAELQNLWKIPVTLIDKDRKNTLSAYIYNISTGGINVRSTTASFNKIQADTIIDTIIQLPDEPGLQCKLLVRQTDTNRTGGFQQLAGQFLNLNARQEKAIQAFVNSVDRKKIKQRAELQAS